MLRHLVDDVDDIDHVALLLGALPQGDDERPVGVGRLIRYANDPTAADIAITVVDQWQGRGAGTALVEAVLARRPPGVTHLRTLTAADNVASLAMLKAAGPAPTRTGHGVVEVRVDLSTRTTGPSAHPPLVVLAVRWYLRFGLSYRDVKELLAERGIEVDHVTVHRWVRRFTPLLADAARFGRHRVGDR
jgi:GNAT superfamily N-acetyltransferase